MSRGEAETGRLKTRLEAQMDRLLEQLGDLERDREELGEEEYGEMRADTMEQVVEFQASLGKLGSGDLGLVDSMSAMQLAIQATVSQRCVSGCAGARTAPTGCWRSSPHSPPSAPSG